MNLHIPEKCKVLHILVPVCMVVPQAVSELLQNRPAQPLGLPVCMPAVGRGAMVVGAHYFAFEVEEPGDKLLLAVR